MASRPSKLVDGLAFIDQAYAAGANSYIQKPVLLDKLAELSQRLHAYWLLTNVVASRPRA